MKSEALLSFRGVALNVYKSSRPEVADEQVVRLAKILVPLVALAGMVFSLASGLDLMLLLLLGYAFVTQHFPALLLASCRTTSSPSGGRVPAF